VEGVYTLDDFIASPPGLAARADGVFLGTSGINDILTFFVADSATGTPAESAAGVAKLELSVFSV
jgi:hypothetical protein